LILDARLMIMITERLAQAGAADDRLVLPFDTRSRSRFRARLTSGEEVGVIPQRGQVLRGGDLLRAGDGRIVEVGASAESVSTLKSDDARVLARAAYHLGNRHVALQVGDGWLRYRHDHVLDDMARGLGLSVILEEAPFEPEPGAYAMEGAPDPGHGHHHGHHHGHADQDHDHDQ
jgi:urease accessory protein